MRKRLLVFFTCFLLIFTSIPVFTFALTADGNVPFHYVALGDASVMGYGMAPGAAYGKVTAGSYAAKIRDTLRQRNFDVTVSQLGMKGMRTEELRFLLDDSYAGDAYLSENFPNIRTKQQTFRNSIETADLITYGLGSVNLGNYLLYMAKNPTGHCNDSNINTMVEEDAEGVRASLESAVQSVVKQIPDIVLKKEIIDGYTVEALLNQYSELYIKGTAYAYYSFCKSYDESIRLIREKNPEADLIVLGLSNMLGDLSFTGSVSDIVELKVDIGNLYEELLIKKANAHMAAAAGITAFLPTESTERFLDEAVSYNDNKTTISKEFKDYCDLYEDDLLLKTAVNQTFASASASARANGLLTAYDTVATSLKDVAGITNVTLTVPLDMLNADLLLFAMSEVRKGKTLMKGLKEKALELAAKTVRFKDAVYKASLNNFVAGPLYGTNDDHRLQELSQSIGRIVMAIGIRTQMGEGFFQMYSANGHANLANKILTICADTSVYSPEKAVSCTAAGNKEFWQKVDGTCYTDEALTNQADRSSLVFKALGHQWGAWKVVRKAAFCKDGQEKRVCMRSGCTAFETRSIPGLGPAGTKITKLTAGKKSFTVNWKKPSKKNLKKTTGYQIRYSLKSSMKGAKTVTVKKNKTVSLTVKKLKSKKKYFVQIRTYKTSGGKNYYSAWSASKTVKTK